MAGLPQGVFAEQSGVVFDFGPVSHIGSLVLQDDIQVAALDDVVLAGHGIREPCEGGTDQHGHAQQQHEAADHKCALGRFDFHKILLI